MSILWSVWTHHLNQMLPEKNGKTSLREGTWTQPQPAEARLEERDLALWVWGCSCVVPRALAPPLTPSGKAGLPTLPLQLWDAAEPQPQPVLLLQVHGRGSTWTDCITCSATARFSGVFPGGHLFPEGQSTWTNYCSAQKPSGKRAPIMSNAAQRLKMYVYTSTEN